MKIVQICLAGSFNENYGYQDNYFPKFFIKSGFEAVTIASVYYKNKDKVIKSTYSSVKLSDGSSLIRLKPLLDFGYWFSKKLGLYKGLNQILKNEAPDIIFLHNFQFFDVFKIVNYVKKNKIILYIDNHSDHFNTARNIISYLYHRIIWNFLTKFITKFTIRFWGVTPSRCDFLTEIYNIPKEKISFLPLGADFDLIKNKIPQNTKRKLSENYNLPFDKRWFISGGNFENLNGLKDTLNIFASNNIQNSILLIFGNISKNIYNLIFKKYLSNNKIIFIGWLSQEEIYNFFLSSEMGVFLGLHSVLWEQAISTGLPCLFNKIKGFEHVNYNDNSILVDKAQLKNEIYFRNIIDLMNDKNVIEKLKKRTSEISPNFNYANIVKKAIGFNNE